MPIPSPPVMQMMEEDDQNEEIVLDGIDPTTAAMPANVQNRYFTSFFPLRIISVKCKKKRKKFLTSNQIDRYIWVEK